MPEGKEETPPVVAEPVEDFGLTEEDFVSEEPADDEETADDQPSPEPGTPAASATEQAAATLPDDATVKPDPQAETPAVPSQQLASPEPKPFVPRVYGGDLPIPGATINDKGEVVVPAAQLQRFLANPDVIRDREVAYKRELDDLRGKADPLKNPTVLKADNLLKTLLAEYDKGENPETGRRYIEEYFDRFHQEYPILEAKAEAAALKKQLEDRDAQLTPRLQEEQARQLEPMDRHSLEQTIQTELVGPEYEGIDVESLKAALWEERQNLFRAPSDQERHEWGLGPDVKRIIDPRIWDREVKRFQFFAKKLKDASAVKVIQDRNAKTLAPTPTPPAVTTKTSAPPATERKRPQSKEEWEERLRQFQNEPAL